MSVKHIDSVSYYIDEVTNNKCIVKFTADWCPPCRDMIPIFNNFAYRFGGQINFLEIDVTKLPMIAEDEKVLSLPSFIFYNHGDRMEELTIIGGKVSVLEKHIKILVSQGS